MAWSYQATSAQRQGVIYRDRSCSAVHCIATGLMIRMILSPVDSGKFGLIEYSKEYGSWIVACGTGVLDAVISACDVMSTGRELVSVMYRTTSRDR